jgi:hypothetical protein
MATPATLIELSVIEERYPRYDPSHGTPDPMVRRLATITTAEGVARFEQTDYGHPGRFNPWDARGIDARLQPRAEALRELCVASTRLLA